MKKSVLIFVLMFGILFSFSFANALTQQEKQNLINQIYQQILQLQNQLQQQTQAQNQIGGIWCYTFNKNLSLGDSGIEVYNLKTALNKEGLLDANLINFNFDALTYDAVISFQNKYKKEILTPSKLKAGTGKVGVATRAKLNKIFSCSLISNCVPVWVCTDWKACSSEKQTRKCSDTKNCNTVLAKPLETQSCKIPKVEIKGNNTAGKISINSGESAVISWQAENVVSCLASGNWSGPKSNTGFENTGNLLSSRIYNISCTDSSGKVVSDTLTVNIISPSIVLKANGQDKPISVVLGKSVKLSWQAEGVKSCYAVGDWFGNKDFSGSEETGFLFVAKKYIYGITCLSYNGKTVSDNIEITVDSPSVILKANGKENSLEITSGSSVNLTWTSSGIASCTALGNWSGSKNVSGSESQGKISLAKFYVIECLDVLGNRLSDSVSVNIKQ